MNWFDATGLTSLAKTALKEAQKTIDKALDIQDESGEEPEPESPAAANPKSSPSNSGTPQHDNTDFFSSWGLSVSAEGSKDGPFKEQPVVTESPSKATTQSMWGSFAGSFFEHPKTDDSTIVQPPKAKSMNVISDSKYGSQDDLFSKSQLVMSDGAESLDLHVRKGSKDEFSKTDERRGSSRSYRLSLVSSRNSSDSVEVLSQSLKTTPDSEAASGQSMSHSSSIGQKLNSDSVEILPDSLISPSSIECLGFDSYSSDKTTSLGSSHSPGDISDKKSTPVGDRTEKADTADSVSLVADDDEDTMSYNSISECTAPTVLDTDEKSGSPFPRSFRSESKLNKIVDKEFIHLEPSVLPVRMQISENSSNDGSWSDRTLNADNDSISLENTVEEPKKETEQEDMLIEKLSDSSSFYNVNVSGEMLRSESSAFVNVEKQQCSGPESDSSQKDGSVKERTSPISSDSKSDLVKIGSDRTSGHTSGDDLETATSSDIEIIPSPNGDNGHFCRSSPAKYGFKHSKFDGTTSPNLVDLVLGKSLATKIRGHNRELSEASVQSNTSDESQGSENERLMRRLCEMTEILEARENRLMEVSRSNAELAENNAELKTQLDTLASKHETGDISTITEEYTQRMSALEKKFQQAIREKDHLRKQLDTLKSESTSRKNSSELENVLKEKDDVIGQLQEEGEKLARQQLQHSNIIKKLRAREKDQEQLIKSLKDKIQEQTSEIERLKRSVAAKEELEVNQIEAVYRLTTANKKMDAELVETKSALDDATQRLESTRTSLEAARKELASLRGGSAELQRLRATQAQLGGDLRTARDEAERRTRELQQLRAEMVAEERRWASREEALRYEVRCARELSHAEPPALGDAAAALLHQLAALQRAALERDTAHAQHTRALRLQLDEAEASLVKAVERERVSREEAASNLERLSAAEGLLQDAQTRLEALTGQCRQLLGRAAEVEKEYASKVSELESTVTSKEAEVSELRERARGLAARLGEARAALDVEKKRNTILQEQMSSRGDVSPPHSVASDTFSNSMWPLDEGSITPTGLVQSALGVEDALSALTRKEGSARALAAQLQAALAARNHACGRLAQLQAELSDYQGLKEQYDALLQMYGEKEEALGEARLDLHDVTQLYKQQLDELVRLQQQVANSQR